MSNSRSSLTVRASDNARERARRASAPRASQSSKRIEYPRLAKVSGMITANFEGATWIQVLNSVIKLANLVEKKEGTIHYLYTKGEMDDDAEIAKTRADSDQGLQAQLHSFGRNVDDDQAVLERRRWPEAGVGHALVSVRDRRVGDVCFRRSGSGFGRRRRSAAPRTPAARQTRAPSGGGSTVGGYQPPTGGNSMSDSDLLIIQDYESNLKIIDQIIQRIDVRPVQVLIEAVIISVDLEHDRGSSESTSRWSTTWELYSARSAAGPR